MSHVAELRRARSLTQRELAQMVGVTEATIRNWENDRAGIDWFVRVAALCEALECSPGDLVKYVDPVEQKEDK